MKRLSENRDLVASLAFLAISTVFLLKALGLRAGRTVEMGPGYFPTLLAVILVLLSLALVAKWLVGEKTGLGRFELQPLVLVTASVVLFGSLVRSIGLIAATLAVVVVSSFASSDVR